MAGSVAYKINSVTFISKKAYVSQSHGLIDRPERKPVLSYEWPDETGTQYDLVNPLQYKERKIWLEMFILGTNWNEIKSNFKAIMDEFDKAGTQSLSVTPFTGGTELKYEVIIDGAVILNKRFQDGDMVGTFTLSMIEPNPTF